MTFIGGRVTQDRLLHQLQETNMKGESSSEGDSKMTPLQIAAVGEHHSAAPVDFQPSRITWYCFQPCRSRSFTSLYHHSSYMKLIRDNRAFTLFFMSYISSHLGEWLTYLASIAALKQTHHGADLKKTMVGILIIVRLLPSVILAPFGGVLADGRDRRQSMVVLDLAGAFTGLLFILAVRAKSIPLIYAATLTQQSVAGLYEPCRSAIVPLLVSTEDELKIATTINGLIWSVVAAFGSSVGGILVSFLGLQACFLIDSVTYLLSALFMFMIPGKYAVCDDATIISSSSPCLHVRSMLLGGVRYLWSSFFGAVVLIKATAALVYGACDVLNVAFSERGNDQGMPLRLGLLFAFVGIGCLCGPLLFDRWTDMENPKGLQISCIVSMGLMASGSILMGVFNGYFWMTCCFTAVRSAGSSVLWINSSLLLQKFSLPQMLGRVSSIDYALALLSEALSAYVAGATLDGTALSPGALSICLGYVGCFLSLCWLIYNNLGRGAAVYDEKKVNHTFSDTSDSPESSVAEKRFLMEVEE